MFLWNGGFKPTLVFNLIDRGNLTAEQVRDIEQLRDEAKRKERELGEVMAGVQESVAAPPLLGLLRLRARGLRAWGGTRLGDGSGGAEGGDAGGARGCRCALWGHGEEVDGGPEAEPERPLPGGGR
ncbi:hypothetical protein CDL15_Pgr014413 [Punica granatum]|uniref:DOG1 domain-containing protein n=1 Tax=Punica granatum TaxID=22663 RepID=A0A218WEH2_PUNGR|nr:hypothetical protein CDL15_Pgr014413 [Punica granatum]PKI64849.1 hypothetical protein CRG98_014764 [Punica granatum]